MRIERLNDLASYYDYNLGYVTLSQMNTYTKLLQKGAYGHQQVALILSKQVPERYRYTYSWAYEYNVTGYIREVPGLMYLVNGSNYFNIFQGSLLTENQLYTVNAVEPGAGLGAFLFANPNLVAQFPLEPLEWTSSLLPNQSMVYVPVSFNLPYDFEYL